MNIILGTIAVIIIGTIGIHWQDIAEKISYYSWVAEREEYEKEHPEERPNVVFNGYKFEYAEIKKGRRTYPGLAVTDTKTGEEFYSLEFEELPEDEEDAHRMMFGHEWERVPEQKGA